MPPTMPGLPLPGTHTAPQSGPPTLASMTLPASIPPPMPEVAELYPSSVNATVTGAPFVPSEPPPIVLERYELGAEIARGGMGRVLEATDTLLGRTVAIKQVLGADADTLRRFARETRITARLEHPAIVPVHDAGGLDDHGAPFYVMRRISGRPLERLVATADELNDRLVLVPHIVAAAQAIAHAHARGVVHRDIKPSNILVGEPGETIVIDWGLAKAIAEPDDPLDPAALERALPTVTGAVIEGDDGIHTRAGIVYGTPGFMAPEQLRGKPVDERCDVYALGATLYHLLSRKPPHFAKDAGTMMHAAAHEPAVPIADVVPGVPRELATIVDTALAFDAAQRYPDARALAEDLQRFLNGQLVASHRYSPRERLVRFVRQHRVSVGIGAIAATALALVGTIAVVRVVAERDRADAAATVAIEQRAVAVEARERAEARAEELVLAQARIEVTQNPTRALAMIAPLAAKRWREVRSIAAAARVNGVAWGMPASPHTLHLERSSDGRRALSVGDDGAVRVYDLAAHTVRSVAQLEAGTLARWADDERRLVTWRAATLTVIELGSGGRRVIPVSSPVRDVATIGVVAHWVDEAGGVWSLDLAGTQPLQRPIDEPISALAASPDGRWLALAGRYNLLAIDLSKPADPAHSLMMGKVLALDWSSKGDRLGAIVGRYSVDYMMRGDRPRLLMRDEVGDRDHVLVARDGLLAGGAAGVGFVGVGEATLQAHLSGGTIGIAEARRETLLAGGREAIAVLGPDGDRALVPPFGGLERIDASAQSPYVLGAVAAQLLVWNLDDVQPLTLAKEPAALARFAGNRHVIAGFTDSPARWIELGGVTSQPLGAWGALLDVAATRDEATACVVDAGHRAHVVFSGPARRPPLEVPGTADVVGFVSPHEIVIGVTSPARVDVFDVRTSERRNLVARPAPLAHLAWSRGAGTWVAAAFADRALWRARVDGGGSMTLTSDAPILAHVIADDGTVHFGAGSQLRVWPATGAAPATLATFAQPIIAMGPAGNGTLVVVLADGATHVVDPAIADPARRLTAAPALVPGAFAMAADTGLLVEQQRGGLDVIDPSTRYRWTLARPSDRAQMAGGRALVYAFPAIAPDGNTIVAQTATTLVAWRLNLPPDAAATEKWLGTLSNATIDPRAASGLGWRGAAP